jgi:hypothetical protein
MVLYTSLEGSQVLQQELVTSIDGVNFERPFRSARGQPFVLARNRNATAFDHSYVFASNGNGPLAVAEEQDEERWYYNGLNLMYEGHKILSGVGFATQRRDRYAAIVAPAQTGPGETTGGEGGTDRGGQVTLRPVDVTGRRSLTLNAISRGNSTAAVQNGSSISVELLTRGGWRLPGFTREECEAVGGGQDSVRLVVRWRNHTTSTGEPEESIQEQEWRTLAQAAPTARAVSGSSEVMVRIYLRGAELFGVTFA